MRELGRSFRERLGELVRIASAPREQSWEKAIAGRGSAEFESHAVSLQLEEGDLVRYEKFGDGIVTRMIDANKVDVMFKEGPRWRARELT